MAAAALTGPFRNNGLTDLVYLMGLRSGLLYYDAITSVISQGDGTFRTQTANVPRTEPSNPFVAQPFTLADVDGDGFPDLEVQGNVLHGNGDGTFTYSPSFPAASGPAGIPDMVTYLTGNGIPDIISQTTNASGLTVLDIQLGNGDGTFGPTVPISAPIPRGSNPLIAVGDFFGTGQMDIAVTASNRSGNISLAIGKGNGTFPTQRSISTGESGKVNQLFAGDYDRDGKMDLVVGENIIVNGNYEPEVFVLPGNGDGTFQAPTARPSTGDSTIAVADFNGDGVPDVAAVDYTSGQITISFGLGNGTFQPGPTFSPGPGEFFTSILAGDFNGDGLKDLAVSVENSSGGVYTSSGVYVLMGDGDGTFQSAVFYPVAGGPVGLAAGDFTGHRRTDLAVLSESDATGNSPGMVSILWNKGDGTFIPGPSYDVGYGVFGIASGKFQFNPDFTTNTRITDLVVVNQGSLDGSTGTDSSGIYQGPSFTVLLGSPDGTFQEVQTELNYPSTATYYYQIGGFAVGDATDQVASDLAIYTFGAGTVLFTTVGDGTFYPSADFMGDSITFPYLGTRFIPTYSPTGGPEFTNLVAANLNGDGLTDLVYADPFDQTIHSYISSLSLVNGQVVDAFSDPAVNGAVVAQDRPVVADQTGDGIPDALTIDESGNILLRMGTKTRNGSLVFNPPIVLNPAAGERLYAGPSRRPHLGCRRR